MLGLTVNVPALVAVPPAVVTPIFPVDASAGTFALICVAVLDVTVAGVPLNVTDVAFARFVPLIVTFAPTMPFAGVKLVTRGRRHDDRPHVACRGVVRAVGIRNVGGDAGRVAERSPRTSA